MSLCYVKWVPYYLSLKTETKIKVAFNILNYVWMLISVKKKSCGFLKVFSFYNIIYQFANVFCKQNLRVSIIASFYLGASSNIKYINVEKSYFSKHAVLHYPNKIVF